MTVTTSGDFLALLEKSGVLTSTGWAAAQEAAGHLSVPKQVARTLVDRKLITPWQAEQLLAGRTGLVLLDKYKLLNQLGAGGMGEVYLAEHSQMNRRVAIKSLSRPTRRIHPKIPGRSQSHCRVRPRAYRESPRCRDPGGSLLPDHGAHRRV